MARERRNSPLCTIIGSQMPGIDALGIGSDFDGTMCVLQGLEDVAQFPNLNRAILETRLGTFARSTAEIISRRWSRSHAAFSWTCCFGKPEACPRWRKSPTCVTSASVEILCLRL